MENIVFKDCEYRFTENNELYCKNKTGDDINCDNCKENIHLNCDNFSPKKDYCLKFFQENISEVNAKKKQCSVITNCPESGVTSYGQY